MLRWLASIGFILLIAPAAFAQGHGGSLSFTPYGNGSSVNVYRAPCTGSVTGAAQPNGGTIGTPSATGGGCSSVGTFALLANVPTANTYTDNSGSVSTGYVYQLTTLCPATGCTDAQKSSGESTPSLQVAAETPPPPKPGSPTGFSVTGVN